MSSKELIVFNINPQIKPIFLEGTIVVKKRLQVIR